ncbi:unspecified product [Leishmania tarentolae]|uniref:Unspecified product n=1 Tax=Leishmania tarentolae TaxID=5689 RepID=A0A640KI06_LEITA|nr:unspecified product [Leishmania tarentolae]
METHATARSQRDTLIIQNLSLRRRCMFLMDHGMWRACLLGISGDAGPAGSSADQLRLSTLKLLGTHSRQLEKIVETGVESIQAAVAGMTTALLSAPSSVSSDAKASSAPTSTEVVQSSSATCSNALEDLCWPQWEEGLETLLGFLEEPRDTSSPQSPTSCRNTLKGNGNAGRDVSTGSRETDLERTVRSLLCELVIHLYEAGRAYYAVQKEEKRPGRTCGKHSPGTPADDRTTGSGRMRVTWSVAAPIAPRLYDVYMK